MAEDITQYPSVKKWLSNVRGNSKTLYTRYFREFCQRANLNPEQAIDMAKKDSESIHDLAKEFYDYLDKQGLSPWTCTVAYSAVRSFCTWNNIRLGPMPKRFMGHVAYESDRMLQPQEVAKMIDMAPTVRDKAIISFLHQSAQRAGILTALRYGDVREQLEKGISPLVMDIKAIMKNAQGVNVNKKATRYKTAIGKETADYFVLMIQQRKEHGETVTDNSWLFVTKLGAPIDLDAIMRIVKHVAKKAGIQTVREMGKDRSGKAKRKYEVHSHVFRRTWKHSMRQGGVTDADLLNFMIGHALPYDGAYDKFTADDIRKEYSRAEPFLTVMFNQEMTLKIELEQLERKFQSATGKKPEEVYPKYPSLTTEQRVQSLKAAANTGLMARRATTEQAKEAVKEFLRIDESEAENHLNHGYELVTVLPSGKLLIRKKAQA